MHRIRLMILTVGLMVVVSFGGVNAQEVRFFEAVPDLPLMAGITELSEQTVEFDKPQGRVVEMSALLEEASVEDVRVYYNATLPQFGWSRIDGTHFQRHNEKLSLSFESVEGHDFLKISIIPQ